MSDKWGDVEVDERAAVIRIFLGLGYLDDLVTLLEEWEGEGFQVAGSRASLARELLRYLRPAKAALAKPGVP